MNNFKYAVVLTGGIATGKSTVASLFLAHDFMIIDADKIAHKLLNKYSSDIGQLFGEEYVENGIVIRKKLGSLIFNNKNEKVKLEKFIHPLIKETIIKEAKEFELKEQVYMIDIPLFFENQSYDIERSIVVYTSKETQIKRLMKRDNSTKKEALSRINNQMNIEEKKVHATYVIDNTKDLQNLEEEVKRVKKLLL